MNRAIAAVIACIALSACQSFSSMGRARIVEPRHVEVWLAPEALIVATDSGASIRPIGELGLRYGVSRVVELDARLTTLGVTVGPRLQLRRSASLERGVDVALAPAIAWTYPDKLALEVPLLVGINLPGQHQLVLGPRFVWQMRLAVPGAPAPVQFLYAGASVGVAFHVSARVWLLPEIAALTQVYADAGYSSNVAGAVGLQAGLGILVDP
jgi:hypothetical protein